jgi:hypothetical protein
MLVDRFPPGVRRQINFFRQYREGADYISRYLSLLTSEDYMKSEGRSFILASEDPTKKEVYPRSTSKTLTKLQSKILGVLRESGGEMTRHQIAEKISGNPDSIAALLSVLYRRGLVSKRCRRMVLWSAR